MQYVRRTLSLTIMLAVGLTGTLAAAQQAGNAANGEKLYAAQKCSLCHKVGAAGGKMGPELTAVGDTRDAAWLRKYLPNPKAQDPKNKMPVTKLTGSDLEDLIAYLGTLKSKT